MAVQQVFYSDRDGLQKALENPKTMLYTSKKEADARDKILELGGELAVFLEQKAGLSEDDAEKAGVALAENRELLKKALKDPSVLNATEETEA